MQADSECFSKMSLQDYDAGRINKNPATVRRIEEHLLVCTKECPSVLASIRATKDASTASKKGNFLNRLLSRRQRS